MVLDGGTVTRITKFVGRDEQLATLKKHLDSSISKKGHIVFVSGDAGIGKTRLAQELELYALSKGVLVLHGGCLSPLGTEPYYPFREALKAYSSSKASAKSSEYVPMAVQATDDRKTEGKSVPMGLMGLDGVLDGGNIDDMSDRIERLWRADIGRERDRMHEAISFTVLGMAMAKPLLLFLDDLQWVDKASLELLIHISRNLKGHKALIVCAYRSEEIIDSGPAQHPLQEALRIIDRESPSDKIALEGLKKKDMRAFVADLLGTKDIPDPFISFIHERTDGNPYFIEEVVKELLERKIIDPADMRWTTSSKLKELALPSSVTDIVQRRLARLDPASLKLLESAAVIGKKFDLEVLKKVTNAEEEKMVDELDRLVKSKILVEETGGETEVYGFTNSTIRDAIYEGISNVKRKLLHRNTAKALEELYGGSSKEMIFTLAQHYSMAKDKANNAKYLVQAGDLYFRSLALEEAVRFYRSALGLMDKAEPTPENLARKEGILLSVGTINCTIGELNAATKELDEAVRVSDVTGNKKVGAMAQYWLGKVFEQRAEIATAQERYQKAFDIFTASSDLAGQAMALTSICWCHIRKAEYSKALEVIQRANEFAEKAGAFGDMVTIWTFSAAINSELGEFESSDECYQRAEELALKEGDPFKLARIYNNWGDLRMRQWRYADALLMFDKCLGPCEQAGQMRLIGVCYSNIGECLVHIGDIEKARPYLEKSKAMFSKLDEKLMSSRMIMVDGVACRKTKQWKKARELHLKAISLAEGLNMPCHVAEYLMEYGITCREEGDMEEARKMLETAAETFKRLGAVKFLERTEKELKAIPNR